MINSIDLSLDNFYLLISLFKIASLLTGLFFIIGFFVLVFVICTINQITDKETKKYALFIKRKSIAITVMIVSAIIFIFSLSSMAEIKAKKISTDKWMLLAQAESTLIQLQVAHEVTNDRPNFDFDQAESWIKDLRKLTIEKDISLGSYYSLVEDFNELQVGKETIYRWFSDNPTTTIKKQLTDGLQSAKNNKQQQTTPEEQLGVENNISEMDEQLSKAGF